MQFRHLCVCVFFSVRTRFLVDRMSSTDIDQLGHIKLDLEDVDTHSKGRFERTDHIPSESLEVFPLFLSFDGLEQ